MCQIKVNYLFIQDDSTLIVKIENPCKKTLQIADTIYYNKREMPGFIGFNFSTDKRPTPSGFKYPLMNKQFRLGYPKMLPLKPGENIKKPIYIDQVFKNLKHEGEKLTAFQVRITLFFNNYLSSKSNYFSPVYELGSSQKTSHKSKTL